MNDARPFTGLTLTQVAHILGVPRLTVWWRAKGGAFPEPKTRLISGAWLWDAADVHAWALAHGRAYRIPLTRWPTDTPAEHSGTRTMTGAIAQCWSHDAGTIAVVWQLPEQYHPPMSQTLHELPGVSAAVFVRLDFDVRSYPNLTGMLPVRRAGEPPNRIDADADGRYDVAWTHLAKVVGTPLPYWPRSLRRTDLIEAWSPGDPVATAPAVPYLDTAALRDLADTYQADHPAAQVLTAMARHAAHQAMDDALNDLRCLDFHKEPKAPVLTIAARPLTVPAGDPRDLDPTTRRGAWLELLNRADTLAATCVDQAMKQDSGADFPYGNPDHVTVDSTAAAREWVARLRPVTVPLPAGFRMLTGRATTGEAMIDPLTDAPVRRRDDTTLVAAMPQRLPATAPLAEVILDRPIWVRTKDGCVWPAPQDSHYGPSWGYTGTGPGTLALTIGHLLDDINATGAHGATGEEALERLLQLPLPKGTVLTRTELDAVRDGNPIPARFRMLARGGNRHATIQDTPPTETPDDDTPDDDQPTGGTR